MPLNYVITAVTDCQMRFDEPGTGMREVLVPAGDAYRRHEGVEHNVINAGDGPMAFVEVELKWEVGDGATRREYESQR